MYCTLLASAQSEVEKSGIKAKMSSDPDLVRILKQLEGEGGEEVRLLKKNYACRFSWWCIQNTSIFRVDKYLDAEQLYNHSRNSVPFGRIIK